MVQKIGVGKYSTSLWTNCKMGVLTGIDVEQLGYVSVPVISKNGSANSCIPRNEKKNTSRNAIPTEVIV